jgi:hypothetical protein
MQGTVKEIISSRNKEENYNVQTLCGNDSSRAKWGILEIAE